MYNLLVIIFAKILNVFANILCKILHKNNGNMLGIIVKKLSPDILKSIKINCPVIAVTATNGKTTTNNAIRYMLEKNGKKVVSNKEGNNMETGIITTLIKSCTLTGKIKADFITFEVDESYLPIVFKKIPLNTLVVLNFFRDQLDRNGEVESLILKIYDFLKTYEGNLILNNDDPNVARLGRANENNKNVYYFSVDKYKYAKDYQTEAGEGKFCPFDKTKLEYEYYQYSHIGKFKCPTCGYGEEPLFTEIKDIDLEAKTFKESDKEYETLANNIYSIYRQFDIADLYDKIYNNITTFLIVTNNRLEYNQKNALNTISNAHCNDMSIGWADISNDIQITKYASKSIDDDPFYFIVNPLKNCFKVGTKKKIEEENI